MKPVVIYAELQKRISNDLNKNIREFRKTIAEISDLFRGLGSETSAWCPEKIYSKNIGGIIADSYVGYSRIEGKWGLAIRTIERDDTDKVFISKRVYAIESCRNVEIIIKGLEKVEDLLLMIRKTTDAQMELLETTSAVDDTLTRIRKPERS
jgi:hypothetical protein